MATKLPHQPQAKQIHFFKIVTAQNLHEGKLMIPNKFAEKYAEGLPNNLFLKTPNGAEWKLKLEKRDGKIWFQEGWKEFAEFYSLAHGHLLFFRRKSTSHFEVHVFDLSALEIDYPSKRTEGKTASNNEGNKPPNDENLEYHRPGPNRKDKSSLEFCRPYQLRSRNCVKVANTKKLKATAVTALDRASSFKPCNPFFLVVMHPYYIGSRGDLNLPSNFCRRHFDLPQKQIINLQVLNGRVWSVKFLITKDQTRTKFRLCGGWPTFAMHNNLKVGDVCMFELIHGTKLTFLVHIFRETDNSNCSTSQESGQMRAACQGQTKKK